jgi:CelD/BcsL family acetyltransferase involved in cellulose biosynthesis
VFQTTGFARSWMDTVGAEKSATPVVVTYEQRSETVALLPLCIVREGATLLLTWLGGPHMLDYGDILFDTEVSDVTVEQFMQTAIAKARHKARGAFLYLPNVRLDAVCYSALENEMQEFKRGSAPYLPLIGTFTDYIGSLGRKRRHNLANFERRLERAGEVDFRILHTGEGGFDANVAEVLRLQRLRFANRPLGAPIFDPCYETFRLEHARNGGGPSVAALTLDGHMIAGSLQCVFGNRMYYLVTAFDQEYSPFAPGKLLVRRLIEYSYEQRLDTFDFCWGSEAYKYFWTHDEEPLVTFVSDGPAGRLLATAASLKRRVAAVMAALG